MPTCRRPASTTSAASSSTPRRLNAFTNPTTNSYKRLVPGYEAPVLLAYSSRNRSASCRIPYVSSPKGKRVEVRFPDPRPTLPRLRGMLMAGLDGIQNKIHPGDPMDKNLYDLPPEELKEVPTVCGSLREALECARRRPRLPAEGRRLHQGPDRGLHRAQVGRGPRVRNDARTRSSSRCTTATSRQHRPTKGASSGRPFFIFVADTALAQ
jgi:hypothetical protein